MRIDELIVNIDDNNFFEMANIRPEKSGLPVVVWLSPRSGSVHAARVKVASDPRPSSATFSIIQIQPKDDIKMIHGDLSTKMEEMVILWIELNYQTIMDFWNEKILYHDDLVAQLKSI